jgi:hypothetical protein
MKRVIAISLVSMIPLVFISCGDDEATVTRDVTTTVGATGPTGAHGQEAKNNKGPSAKQSGAAGAPAPQPEANPEPSGGGGGGGGGTSSASCEPGYDPCVPPYPPDLDCPDVSGPISVTGSDPHGLDADGDGVGCES